MYIKQNVYVAHFRNYDSCSTFVSCVPIRRQSFARVLIEFRCAELVRSKYICVLQIYTLSFFPLDIWNLTQSAFDRKLSLFCYRLITHLRWLDHFYTLHYFLVCLFWLFRRARLTWCSWHFACALVIALQYNIYIYICIYIESTNNFQLQLKNFHLERWKTKVMSNMV